MIRSIGAVAVLVALVGIVVAAEGGKPQKETVEVFDAIDKHTAAILSQYQPDRYENLIYGRLSSDIARFGLDRDRSSGRLTAEVVGHDPVPCPAPEPPSVQVWVLKTDGTSIQAEGAPILHPVRGDDNRCTFWWSIPFPSATRAELAGAVLKIGDRMFVKPLAPERP